MGKLGIIGSWAVLIILVFIYANQTYPYTTGIDFFSTALGALFGAWLIGAIFFGIMSLVYKAVRRKKMPGFGFGAPLIGAVLTLNALLLSH